MQTKEFKCDFVWSDAKPVQLDDDDDMFGDDFDDILGKETTGIKYEPWHIRYVGMPHAKIIYNNHITLEEYVFSLENGVWYEVDGYLISRQKLSSNNTLNIIENSSNIVISPDNTGSYIITLINDMN